MKGRPLNMLMKRLLTNCLALILGLCSFAQNFQPENIEIIRDAYGVPHIYAPTDPEVAYGLAWAHAEDDFKTIQLTMLGAKQMLGRHLGKQGATVDYVVGLLRCEEIVQTHLTTVSSPFMRLVEGYVAGFNAYAEAHPKEVLVKQAFPINVKDVFKAYVLQLAVMDGADRVIKDLFDSKVPSAPLGTGSNAIAISRKKTEDEYTYLAVNSHQPLEGAAAWYEAHLVSDQGWNALGGLFPGGPVIFHGTNEHLGWAHTVNYPDKVDVFELEMHPDMEDQYKHEGAWLDLEVKEVALKVKLLFGIPITVKKKAYHSIYGPVVKNEDGVFAFKMGVFDEIRAIEQWYEMNKASNLSEFKAILSDIRIPSFNMVYADRFDDIFYVSNGLLPMRNSAYDWTTTLPGTTAKTLTTAYHPFSDLPQLTNPPSGYLFNMNNAPFNATGSADNLDFSDYDPTMGFVIRENNRSTRLGELMQQYGGGDDRISWEEFLKMKYDAQLPDSLVYAININPLFADATFQNPKANRIVQMIKDWDKVALADRVGPAQAMITYDHLKEHVSPPQYQNPTYFAYEEALVHAYDYLEEHFGKTTVSLGEYQQLVRGKKELPLSGIQDVITAMKSVPHQKGRVKGQSGESYIMLVRYPREGLPIIETVNVYGASNKPGSPHYDDQMELFTSQQRKKMTLDLDEVRKRAVKSYHPK